jgi:antitoxin component of MazEF toxin-antitoxin module
MKHKVIKVGNSLAITLPSAFIKARNLKAGQEIFLNVDAERDMLFIRTTKEGIAGITPEFKSWLDKFNEDHFEALSALSKH